jgi:hypothetical protein
VQQSSLAIAGDHFGKPQRCPVVALSAVLLYRKRKRSVARVFAR